MLYVQASDVAMATNFWPKSAKFACPTFIHRTDVLKQAGDRNVDLKRLNDGSDPSTPGGNLVSFL